MSDKAARARQEHAQQLVARGDVRGAVTLLDRWLAEHDGDWGLWLYHAGLLARLGRRDQAVAAYCASARQLEFDGALVRAANALREAVKLAPHERRLTLELARLERAAAPRPVVRPERSTDPHLAIFDILDAEARGRHALA